MWGIPEKQVYVDSHVIPFDHVQTERYHLDSFCRVLSLHTVRHDEVCSNVEAFQPSLVYQVSGIWAVLLTVGSPL